MLLPAMPAFSQATGTGALNLVSQTDWVGPGAAFDLVVNATTDLPAEDVELVVTVFNPVTNRSLYRQTLEDKISGSSIILERRPLAEVAGPDGNAAISLPVNDVAQRRYYLRNPGVYPVRVDLRVADSATILDRFVTHLIKQQDPAAVKLGVTTILPVGSPLSPDPAQPFVVPDGGSSVNTINETLAANSTVPVAVIPQPETIERLQRDENEAAAPALESFKQAQGDQPVLPTTWAPLPTTLFSGDFTNELNRQFAKGHDVVSANFPTVDAKSWAATQPLDNDALTVLRARGIERIIVREQDLAAEKRETTLTRPFSLAAGKNKARFAAGQADSGLADHFGDPEGPVLGAHRLLADLAVLWGDRPALQRTVVVMPPQSWRPDPAFLGTYLKAFETTPLLTATSLDGFFTTPIEGTIRAPLVRQLAAVKKSPAQTVPASDIRDEREQIDGLRDMAVGDNPVIDDLERRLLLAERADLDTKARSGWIDAAKEATESQLAGIRLPAERSIRLTARQGEIPVTVQNDNGYPVRVQVLLEGNKLAFPDGGSRTIDVSREFVTERFAVEARTSGAFGVQVRIESPNGKLVVERSEITVRSTATSAVGVGLSIGAIAFLVLWWIRSAIKSRRVKRLAA